MAKQPELTFQILEWYAQDDPIEYEDSEDPENEYVIRIFGRTLVDSKSVTCKINGFNLYFYIKVSNTFGLRELSVMTDWISQRLGPLSSGFNQRKTRVVVRKDLWGFTAGAQYKFVKLVFSSLTTLTKCKYFFKNSVSIPGVTPAETRFKLYESNVEGIIRFAGDSGIQMAGFVTIKKYTVEPSEAKTDISVSVNYTDVTPIDAPDERPSFLQMSWDIETFSHDYSFPDPRIPANVIYQIATTLQHTASASESPKPGYTLFTLKKCDHIPGTKVIECKNETDLLLKWAKHVSDTDPDVMYTYNGDSFDCMYVCERSKLLGIQTDILQILSRLNDVNCILKHETFNSSAYGDSDFVRLYIPGRLNYDLLIHYKRGMKKYPSYKLDNIAFEILGDKKHDVSVRQIFDAYSTGVSSEISRIGAYCVQDTALLQRLVDAQMILVNAIQMANVTHVPVSYLTTRGQTVKVFSQILRVSAKLGFVVPHTNFNTETFETAVRVRNSSGIRVGDYITLYKPRFNGKVTALAGNVLTVSSDTELEKPLANVSGKCGNSQVYVINATTIQPDDSEDSFTGATVLDPVCGLYTDNVAIEDFASMYPMNILSRNLCFSTLVFDERYDNLPNVDYETIEWDDVVATKLNKVCDGVFKSGQNKGGRCPRDAVFISGEKHYCRIHNPDKTVQVEGLVKNVHYRFRVVQATTQKGVLPTLVEELYYTRKRVKKESQQAYAIGNTVLAGLLDAQQNAIKVSLNSVYGFVSRSRGNLVCNAIGKMTTSIGRKLIQVSKEYTENGFVKHLQDSKLVTYQLGLAGTALSDDTLKKFGDSTVVSGV